MAAQIEMVLPSVVKQPRFVTDASRWEALRNRDPAADGHFLYSVKTTGVYCRPSCAKRMARPEHVAFHSSREEAERAGFRPCKRCRPDLPLRAEREAALIAESCRTIERADEELGLAQLAQRAGVSAFHFHRLFKRVTGVTPRAYAAAQRQRRAQENLSAGAGVTEALYAAGFNSSSRFYESAPEILGMAPSAYRNGGKDEALWHAAERCSLGYVLVAATARGTCSIMLGDNIGMMRKALFKRFPHARHVEPTGDFARTVAQVVGLVDDPSRRDGWTLPLDIRGTAFQRRVWEELRKIPSGSTATYGEIARRIHRPAAVRAVAAACAANPIAVVIPCHRVIAADGGLAGYRWGIERKRRLLDREHAVDTERASPNARRHRKSKTRN